MPRIHRSLVRRSKNIDATRIADEAEDYLYGLSLHNKYLQGATGLINGKRIKNTIKHIDQLEREIIRHEDRIDSLIQRRNLEAAKLESALENNLDIIRDYLEPEELRDFKG